MTNAVKAIDDAIEKYESGAWSLSRTRIFLRNIGMTDASIDELLEECAV